MSARFVCSHGSFLMLKRHGAIRGLHPALPARVYRDTESQITSASFRRVWMMAGVRVVPDLARARPAWLVITWYGSYASESPRPDGPYHPSHAPLYVEPVPVNDNHTVKNEGNCYCYILCYVNMHKKIIKNPLWNLYKGEFIFYYKDFFLPYVVFKGGNFLIRWVTLSFSRRT
jgi:hypothetical protein